MNRVYKYTGFDKSDLTKPLQVFHVGGNIFLESNWIFGWIMFWSSTKYKFPLKFYSINRVPQYSYPSVYFISECVPFEIPAILFNFALMQISLKQILDFDGDTRSIFHRTLFISQYIINLYEWNFLRYYFFLVTPTTHSIFTVLCCQLFVTDTTISTCLSSR